MNPNTRYTAHPSSSNNKYFRGGGAEETLNQGLDRLEIGSSRSGLGKIIDQPQLDRLPSNVIRSIGANLPLSQRSAFKLTSRQIHSKDDFSYEPEELHNLGYPKDGFRYPNQVTPKEISEWVHPPVCQEIAKQFLKPECDLQDMHDLRNWTLNGLAALISSPYLPIKNEKFMDNLAIAMENMPEEDSEYFRSLFTTKKRQAFARCIPENKGNKYHQDIQDLNNGLTDINSADFESKISVPSFCQEIAKKCTNPEAINKMATIAIVGLSSPDTDIAACSLNIISSLLKSKFLDLPSFDIIKNNPLMDSKILFPSRHCSSELVDDLLAQNPTSSDILIEAAKCLQASAETLKKLVNHDDSLVCSPALQNPNIPLEAILEKLKKLNEDDTFLKGETVKNPKVQKILTACFLYANQRMQRMESSPSAAAGY